ncbi:hypothetical protein Tco_1058977, partial [Tanacetum coccineum]
GSGKEAVSKKRAVEKLSEESVQRQKLEDDAEKAELKLCLEIAPNDDKAINIEPLATKSPIVLYPMLDDFDIQYLIDLYRLVKERFKTTQPEGYDRLLWGDLMTIFEPSEQDELWRNQQHYSLISWELFDSCGVHSLLMDTVFIHMLEKRLEIGKCNRKLNPGKIQRQPTFQVVLDALSLNPCYSAFLIIADMHQPWRTFAALINRSLSGKTSGLDKLRLSKIDNKAYKKQEKIFVSTKEETQIYGAILPESLTSLEMKETKAYKTYLGFATGTTPPKKARKFKKPTSPKLTIVLASTEEHTRKSKRVKRPTKKSTKAPARGVVIRETPELPLSKKKEKVDVTRGKGIELLSQVALNEDA